MSARLISVADAAELIGAGERSVWRWIAAGRLPAYKVGDRLTRVKPEDVAALAVPRHYPSAQVPARAETDNAGDPCAAP
jgi:excisionase family DNA binding protein